MAENERRNRGEGGREAVEIEKENWVSSVDEIIESPFISFYNFFFIFINIFRRDTPYVLFATLHIPDTKHLKAR